MKTFLMLTLGCFFLIFSAQAQERQYTPNARQSIQKSRMQQPQYMQVTAPKEEVKEEKQTLKPIRVQQPQNYQITRPLAIDAPKRRGDTTGRYSVLAEMAKKQD